MKRNLWILVVVVAVLSPSLVHAQAPSDDCTSGPVVEIAALPFFAGGTMYWDDTVNFNTDIGVVCSAGAGGTPALQASDFVYMITLGVGHDVDCSFASNIPGNSSNWVFVLSTSCESPLAGSNCVWGEVVPELTSAAFNTAALGLDPGTYYLWFDQESCCAAWQVSCSGSLEAIFFDGFESGGTSNWSATVPTP